jgi:hypothetical protein
MPVDSCVRASRTMQATAKLAGGIPDCIGAVGYQCVEVGVGSGPS